MKRFLILAAALLLVGCATSHKPVAFQATEKQLIKQIAIIDLAGDNKPNMNPGQLPGGQVLYAFGALGGAILGSIEGSRFESATNSSNEAIAPYNPSLKAAFLQKIQTDLQAKGYEVIVVSAPLKLARGKDFDLSQIEQNVDAVLVGSMSSGYSKEFGGVCPRCS